VTIVRMPTMRSPKLERLLGGPIDDTLSFDQVMRLIPNAVEGSDLEFKGKTYPTSGAGGDQGKKELCADVAGMANAIGGIVIIGIEEDDQARAARYSPVDISDAERLRLASTLLGNVQPMLTFDIHPIEDPQRPGQGFLVIWVVRDAGSPHAYCQGTEIAEAYRARFAGLANRIDEAERVEAEFLKRLDTNQGWLVATLVPDLPGGFSIDQASFRDFQAATVDQGPRGFGLHGASFNRALVRRRRLVGTGLPPENKDVYTWTACELHENGNGAFGSRIDRRPRTLGTEEAKGYLIDDEVTIAIAAAAIRYLAQHARNRAAAGGLATIRMTIYPVTVEAPVTLTQSRMFGLDNLGRYDLPNRPVADTVANIDAVAIDGPGLVGTTHRLVSDLFQEFGVPEPLQLTVDGALRLPYWHREAQGHIEGWAKANGVEIIREAAN
jgi:hypothetical protein